MGTGWCWARSGFTLFGLLIFWHKDMVALKIHGWSCLLLKPVLGHIFFRHSHLFIYIYNIIFHNYPTKIEKNATILEDSTYLSTSGLLYLSILNTPLQIMVFSWAVESLECLVILLCNPIYKKRIYWIHKIYNNMIQWNQI